MAGALTALEAASQLASQAALTAEELFESLEFVADTTFVDAMKKGFQPKQTLSALEKFLNGDTAAIDAAATDAALAVGAETAAATVLTAVETAGGLLIFGLAVRDAVVGADTASVRAVSNRLGLAQAASLGIVTAALVATVARFLPKTANWPDSDLRRKKQKSTKRYRRMGRSRRG